MLKVTVTFNCYLAEYSLAQEMFREKLKKHTLKFIRVGEACTHDRHMFCKHSTCTGFINHRGFKDIFRDTFSIFLHLNSIQQWCGFSVIPFASTGMIQVQGIILKP
jgi:hypothetical protein